MEVTVVTDIRAPTDAVWRVISDIENSPDVISAIEGLEILEPASGPSMLGLKWQETRSMFGKQATEVMWITAAEEGVSYEARAESHGAVYRSILAVESVDVGTRLSMQFHCKPVSFGARFIWLCTGFFVKGSMRKALQKDLDDIRLAVEASQNSC